MKAGRRKFVSGGHKVTTSGGNKVSSFGSKQIYFIKKDGTRETSTSNTRGESSDTSAEFNIQTRKQIEQFYNKKNGSNRRDYSFEGG